jgi:hypothetical protein
MLMSRAKKSPGDAGAFEFESDRLFADWSFVAQ